mmetsp:Transcript_57118/g.134025  ORF Transcript_57118/g.134025 Transcript_57118/m.134025 type:complete len:203 (+) Transcript_57118:708-1316(+)
MEAAAAQGLHVDDGPRARRLLPPQLHQPDHPPRPQARQPPPHRRRPPQGVRLWAVQDAAEGQGRRDALHDDRLHRHQALHGPRSRPLPPQLRREGGRVLDGHDLLLHGGRRAPLRAHRPRAHLRPRRHPRPPPGSRQDEVAGHEGAGGDDVGGGAREAADGVAVGTEARAVEAPRHQAGVQLQRDLHRLGKLLLGAVGKRVK